MQARREEAHLGLRRVWDRACGLRLAFDPVGTGVAWSMIGQIEVTFLERKVYSDRIVV